MESYRIAVKQKARKLEMKFLKRNVRDIKNANILFFPGPEAQEVPMLEKIGFQRENMYCLERDPKAFRILSRNSKAKGCNLFNKGLTEFIDTEKGATPQFEALILDFTETFGDSFWATIAATYLLTKPDFVLITNFLCAREKLKAKIWGSFGIDANPKKAEDLELSKERNEFGKTLYKILEYLPLYAPTFLDEPRLNEYAKSWEQVSEDDASLMHLLKNYTPPLYHPLVRAAFGMFLARRKTQKINEHLAARYHSGRSPMRMDFFSVSPWANWAVELNRYTTDDFMKMCPEALKTFVFHLCKETFVAPRNVFMEKPLYLGRESAHPLRRKLPPLSERKRLAKEYMRQNPGYDRGEVALMFSFRSLVVVDGLKAHLTSEAKKLSRKVATKSDS